PADSAIARDTIAARRQARSGASQAGRNPTEHRSAAPAGAVHERPFRPRPAVCSPAAATQTSGTPSRSQPATTSFVEPTRSNHSSRDGNVTSAGPRQGRVDSLRIDRIRPLELERAMQGLEGGGELRLLDDT